MDSTAERAIDSATKSRMTPIVLAASVGTVIEWYDFLIYGTAASLAFNKLFFPSIDPLVGTLAAFGSYAVGFFARPFGGALFGHFGDRLGRKSMLMLTLLIMGGGTFLIGCLPTYASIGVAAPILLIALRLIQGLGLGGEWGGASLLVLEHAEDGKRGFYGSLVQIGFPLGLVLSSLAFTLVAKLSPADFLAWGWRLPFLASAVLVLFGLLLRTRLSETPLFARLRAENRLLRLPLLSVITGQPRALLSAIGLKISEVSWIYILTVFLVFYATSTLGLSKSLILDSILYGALLELLTIPLFGWLADRIGRRPMFLIGAVVTMVIAFPVFSLIETRDPTTVMISIIVAMSLGHGMMFAAESAYFPELFPTSSRYSGASFGFQVAAALGGGLAPIIATLLSTSMGGSTGVSVLLIGFALITLTAALTARETQDIELEDGQG